MPVFKRRYMMFDIARQRTFRREEMLVLLDTLQRLGYNGLGLYMEAAFDFSAFPGVIREGVMTRDDALWIRDAGEKRGIFVFPMTNVVGHMEHFFRNERYRPLMSDVSEMQLDFQNPDAEAFVMRILYDYADAFGKTLLHIGGDETQLTPDTEKAYAAFLGKICDNLIREGITPGIWDDMIWMNPELCPYIDRRTVIFDWNYYGHRKQSPVFFRDAGFKDVFVCPCDNSWEGVISNQRTTGHLKAEPTPVAPGEIEAFLSDGAEAGIDSAMPTAWEDTGGRNFWTTLAAFARAALYMNGKWQAGEDNDDAIETALFGRRTTYTALTRTMRDVYENPAVFGLTQTAASALVSPDTLLRLLKDLRKTPAACVPEFAAGAEKLRELFAEWKPRGDLETLCYRAMRGNIARVAAMTAIVRAGNAYALYAAASDAQFSSPDAFREKLTATADAFRDAAASVRVYAADFAKAIKGTGHNAFDLVRIRTTAKLLSETAVLIASLADKPAIPLPRFECLAESVIGRKYLIP